jgi:hypothetical protein
MPAEVPQHHAPSSLVTASTLAPAEPLHAAPPSEAAAPRAAPVPIAAVPERASVPLPPVPSEAEAAGAASVPVEPVPPVPVTRVARPVPESPPDAPEPPQMATQAPSARGVAVPPSAALPRPLEPAGSPIGLGLDRRVRVAFDGSRTRRTSEPALTVSGRLLGATPQDFVLRVNDAGHATKLDGRAFQAMVGLQPGPNRITAIVTGPDGQEAEDTITVDYTPRAAPNAIALTSPRNGLVLGPDDPPAIVVEGSVEDAGVATVSVIANGHALTVPVHQGRFRQVVPVLEPLVHLWAQSLTNGAVQRSETASVARPATGGPVGLLLLQWGEQPLAAPVEVSAAWRAAPGRLDVPAVPLTLRSFGQENGAPGADGYYLRNLRPGAYTFVLRAGRGGAEVRPTFYYADSAVVLRRPLKALALDGRGPMVLARMLLPYGVLWEENAWFTGKSESAETIVKFRVPEGITWAERKVDLR